MNFSPFILCLFLSITVSSCGRFTPKQQHPIQQTKQAAPTHYGPLLKKYVTPTGVKYDDWAQSPEDLSKLNEVSNYYANHQPPSDSQEALAWHLNAYNAFILQQILSDWPNNGPLDSSLLFFHKKRITLSGKRMSFLHLENKIIREQFKDPKIHFALNCASRSCPALHHEPFQAHNLDKTLHKLTTHFLNQNSHALLESKDEIQLSKIFDWFAEDFGGKENLIPYINQYRKQKVPLDKKVSFLKYDWQLNSSK